MFIQTQPTPNPNSLKFVPGKTVSNSGSHEITKKDNIDNELVRNILSINGVVGVFLGKDFISVNKDQSIDWEDIKHIAISLINEFYQSGNKFVIDKESDIDEVFGKYITPFDIPTGRVWLMPCCGSREEHIEKAPMVAELAKRYRFNFSPRLHLLIWDMALKV